MTVQEELGLVEASLGGRVDAQEMRAFGEELEELLEGLAVPTFYLLIDHSKAKAFDHETTSVLSWIKDSALDSGAEKIFTVTRDETDKTYHTTMRLQAVLEGREELSSEYASVQIPSVGNQVRLAA